MAIPFSYVFAKQSGQWGFEKWISEICDIESRYLYFCESWSYPQ
jgi:hypothetical protein